MNRPTVSKHSVAAMRRIICLGLLACSPALASQAIAADTPAAAHTASTQPVKDLSMEFSLKHEGEALTGLSARPQGGASTDWIAASGRWSGVAAASASGDTVRLTPAGDEMAWDIPFVSEGYYDADRHLNFPDPETTDGAVPLVLPVRRLVTCAGQEIPVEFFKRLHKENHSWVTLNMTRANQLLVVGDPTLGYDLLLTFPGVVAGTYKVHLDKLTLTFPGITGEVTMQAVPHGAFNMPGNYLPRPVVEFTPDFVVEDTVTGKQQPASATATDLFRFGLFWWDKIKAPSDWGQASAEYSTQHDPRSDMLKAMRQRLLIELGYIGYDRYGHFGYKTAWGVYPDYGAPGLLNVPENNGSVDMRFLHLNGQWALTLATYTLNTGDTSVLNARRNRWLATDGEPQHPLSQINVEGDQFDVVLAASDIRVDQQPPTTVFTLGQTFTAAKPFKSLTLRLGNDSGTHDVEGEFTLRKLTALDKPFDGALVQQGTFTVEKGKRDTQVTLELEAGQEPGLYFIEIADTRSKRNVYFGPHILWYSDYEGDYAEGLATHGPIVGGTNYDRAKLLLDYIIEHAGGAKENLQSYVDDRKYNVPNYKSGRPGVSTTGTYWERCGGGHDAQEGLYYNAGLDALVQLARLTGNEQDAAYYGDLHAKADEAFRNYYWHTVEENGKTFSRFFGARDWDGTIHDYGFTYENLEMLTRGIGTPEQAQAVVWWLDRGDWSPDGGTTWHPDIFSIWRVGAPYNTIASEAYYNVTGTLPFREVLTNGGTRLDITGREFFVRSKYVSMDNMHERMGEVLGRYINPDRLTGGRTYDDPGLRGRWHFGPPFTNRADIEGYREFFSPNSAMISCFNHAYLGAESKAEGLWIRPELPSSLDSFKLEGFGYRGAVVNFEFEAERNLVKASAIEGSGNGTFTFTAAAPFNKVGVPLSVESNKPAQVSLTLERKAGDGWEPIATNWYTHAKDGQTVYVPLRQWLPAEGSYRLRVHDLKDAQLATDAQPALVAEHTLARLSTSYPEQGGLSIKDESGKQIAEGNSVSVRVDAGQRLLIKPTL